MTSLLEAIIQRNLRIGTDGFWINGCGRERDSSCVQIAISKQVQETSLPPFRPLPKTWRVLTDTPVHQRRTLIDSFIHWTPRSQLFCYDERYLNAIMRGEGRLLTLVDIRHHINRKCLYLLGFLHCFYGQAEDGTKYLDIASLCVHDKLRRQGVARALLECELMRDSKLSNFEAYAHLPPQAFEAVNLLRSYGFKMSDVPSEANGGIAYKDGVRFQLMNQSVRQVFHGRWWQPRLDLYTSWPLPIEPMLPKNFPIL